MTDLRTSRLRGCFCCGPSSPSLSKPSRRGFVFGAGALAPTVPDGTLTELKRFFYDTAQTLQPRCDVGAGGDHSAIADRIRNGFPVPHRHRACEGGCARRVFTEEQIAAIERGNAIKRIPRLAS